MSFIRPEHRARAELELRRRRALAEGVHAAGGADAIPESMSFLEWVERLASNGLKVDGQPFDLSNRPALREIYATIPSTKAEGYNKLFSVIKGAQTGATVLTFLLQLYLALKHEPIKIGSYYPDRSLAAYVSSSRFLPVVRSVPVAHKALLAANGGGEGNVLTRQIGASEVLYLWTSGSSITESFPLSAVIADEVQNMLDDDIESIKERMSASDVRFFFACSTAKWPGADIDLLYQRGDRRRFHTACQCDDGVILDEVFPACIQLNDQGQWPEAPADYIYVCPTCDAYIPDPQQGRWVRHNPESRHISFHLPQTLSPTISPREIVEAYRSATDLQNFYNKKLGKAWTDPTQVSITLAICDKQVEAGRQAGVVWKTQARDTFLGIDQMGNFIVAIVLERLPDGRMALVHCEFIYDADPFKRCSKLMEQFGVRTCVVEINPNYNDAKRFANRHLGKVFLANYADLRDDAMIWSDQDTPSDRRTIAEDRTRYTVSLNQYRCMQVALDRIRDGHCLFPDPNDLHQDILEKGVKRRVAILREVFVHLTKVALVVEQDAKTRKPRPRVEKISIDPHAAYAFMLANVAWSRTNGGGMMLFADDEARPVHPRALPQALPQAGRAQVEPAEPSEVVPAKEASLLAIIREASTAPTCGGCGYWKPQGGGFCDFLGMASAGTEAGCSAFFAKKG